MIFAKQIEKLYRSQLYVRNDNAMGIFYYDAEDFPGLNKYAYSFRANAGHNLQGYFYCYDAPKPGRLVVFDHGLGNGHRAYMKEIERLARAGYLVFSYDHTGCMESGGAHTNGFAQSLSDLDACLKTLKAEPELQGRKISVMGHSWGGFSTLNIAALHPDVAHVIVMSGFISVEQMVKQNFSGILSPWRKGLYELECAANPEYVKYSALDSLQKTDAQILLIYSDNDALVKKEYHYDPLEKALSGKENVQLLLVNGKGHSPNYTASAVKLKDTFFAQLEKLTKQKALSTDEQKRTFMESFDWAAMTEQDESVWQVILETLEK